MLHLQLTQIHAYRKPGMNIQKKKMTIGYVDTLKIMHKVWQPELIHFWLIPIGVAYNKPLLIVHVYNNNKLFVFLLIWKLFTESIQSLNWSKMNNWMCASAGSVQSLFGGRKIKLDFINEK